MSRKIHKPWTATLFAFVPHCIKRNTWTILGKFNLQCVESTFDDERLTSQRIDKHDCPRVYSFEGIFLLPVCLDVFCLHFEKIGGFMIVNRPHFCGNL